MFVSPLLYFISRHSSLWGWRHFSMLYTLHFLIHKLLLYSLCISCPYSLILYLNSILSYECIHPYTFLAITYYYGMYCTWRYTNSGDSCISRVNYSQIIVLAARGQEGGRLAAGKNMYYKRTISPVSVIWGGSGVDHSVGSAASTSDRKRGSLLARLRA